jgi:hypothetical protein
MKNILLLIVLFLSCSVAAASGLPAWVNPEAARAYAEAALIEWSSATYKTLDRTRLNARPAVLARLGSKGEKIVLVVYESSRGSYTVTLVVDQDNFLRVFERGARSDAPAKMIENFYDPRFDPSTLLEEG